jgi:hypothetical protein
MVIRGSRLGKGPDAMVRDVKHCADDDEVDNVLQSIGDLQVQSLPVLITTSGCSYHLAERSREYQRNS